MRAEESWTGVGLPDNMREDKEQPLLLGIMIEPLGEANLEPLDMCKLVGRTGGAVQCLLNIVLCNRLAGAGGICTAGNAADKQLVFYQVLVDILHVTPIEICRQHAACT